MAFYVNAYDTTAYERQSIASSATSLAPGTAVKLVSLPTSLMAPGFYYQFAAAGTGDEVFGVVSARGSAITDSAPGKVVFMNSGLMPVLMNAAGTKGDLLKVVTADGKWGACSSGDLSDAELVEDVAAAGLAWARPKKVVKA